MEFVCWISSYIGFLESVWWRWGELGMEFVIFTICLGGILIFFCLLWWMGVMVFWMRLLFVNDFIIGELLSSFLWIFWFIRVMVVNLLFVVMLFFELIFLRK